MSFVTLIRPPMTIVRLVQARSTCPPIGLAYLAACLRESSHQVEVIDAVGEAIFNHFPVNDGKNFAHGMPLEEIVKRINPNTDYIGISCMFTLEWPISVQLIQLIKQAYPNKKIIVGGEHVTASGQWILDHTPEVDYCVLGEGENKLVSLIEALSKNLNSPTIDGILSRTQYIQLNQDQISERKMMEGRIKDINQIPRPAWDLIPLANYIDNGYGYGVDRGRNMPMLATRGCPYRCTFCSSPQMWTIKWSYRDPEDVLAEMEDYIEKYQAENFSFYDLTAIVRKDWIIKFCNLIIDRGHQFSWQLPSGTRSEAIDEEVADLLYRSGCRNLNYAPESGSPSVLKRIKKRLDLKNMRHSMRACIKKGLIVKSNTIIGFPGEKHYEVWQTFLFLMRIAILGVHETTISCYIPYPGSELYQNLRKENKINDFSADYFWNMATTSNIAKSKSWSDYISDRSLAYYRIFGLLCFYMVSFSVRPKRFFIPLFNVIFKRGDQSRMEENFRLLFRKIARLLRIHKQAPQN